MKTKLISQIVAGAGVATASVLAGYAFAIRPWHLRWGATADEQNELLPGDEVVPNPEHQATHAITIEAPVAGVWQWLVQIGQSRGGFYSYTWLENLVGCDMHNADRVVPEWQNIRVGDVVWLHPEFPPLSVIVVEPFKAIVLGSPAYQGDAEWSPNAESGTWGFFLKKVTDDKTRLITRMRFDRNPGTVNWIYNYAILEPAHFIMERKMMIGIKQRAEGQIRVTSATQTVTDSGILAIADSDR